MKRLLRPLLFVLPLLALPAHGKAGTAAICTAAPATGVAAMMSRHAAVKSQIEAEWQKTPEHGHCLDRNTPVPETLRDGNTPAMDAGHAAHEAVGQEHERHARAQCMALNVALSESRHMLPRPATVALVDIGLDGAIQPGFGHC